MSLDIATKVCYSSEVVGQLLVATRSCRLLRFDAEMGQVISEVETAKVMAHYVLERESLLSVGL